MDDLELEVTESAPEDVAPADGHTGDTVPTDETETSGSDETPETDPEESEPEEESEKAESADGTETPGSENQPEDSEPEDLTDEPADDTGETVSGNEAITISGNAVIFPEGFDLSLLGSGSESNVDQTALIEAVENQSAMLYNISAAMIFLLGVIAGILLIHGFRLRRT